MNNYQTILVAIDIYAAYQPIIERARALAQDPADLSLIYVTLPHVFFEPYGAAFDSRITTNIKVKSNKTLRDIAAQYQIPDEQVHGVTGDPADEIHRLASDIRADLIVLGTHGKSGIKLLLGSTANAVLHGVQQDVLAVRVE